MQSVTYPLLQAYQTQDKIRQLLELGYKFKDKGSFEHAKNAFLKARELVNYTTGNKAVYRMISSEVKALRIDAARAEVNRMI